MTEVLVGLFVYVMIFNHAMGRTPEPPSCYYEAPVYEPVIGSANLQSLLSSCEVKDNH